MNAVEIEEAVSQLAAHPFAPEEFPFAFLEAYGNKETTVKRLRKGNSNKSKIPGAVLQRNNIHIATCEEGKVADTLQLLQDAPETTKNKAKFILATDGKDFQAEALKSGETLACNYPDFHNHFSFFFELAGISSVKEIRESSFDIKATGRLNKLYIELLRTNPDWAAPDRREDMNHFLARLIFCFFAEDTQIFNSDNLFTHTVEQMSAPDASDTHEIIGEIFRAMDIPRQEREAKGVRNWANRFPYVNGALFTGADDCPRFTKIARSYLLHVGKLDWKQINPDIFGSMIQAVADEDERSSLGMHYTSVPNILKVLNPLFLDELNQQLEEAADNPRKLLNLRKRLARIRVFDPACGSGNFLVIAYKQMRQIEQEINSRRGEPHRESDIPLTNFRGIELRGFSAEVARLALIIAEYQCDVLYRGQQLAMEVFLPLSHENWIVTGNALRLDWLSVCPPTGTGVKVQAHHLSLFSPTEIQTEIGFENEGGETFICGNPPYKGRNKKNEDQKKDLEILISHRTAKHKSLDYVAGWFIKLSKYMQMVGHASGALVATNSICQGEQVPILWSLLYEDGSEISFAYRSFKWANLASYNAGVTVVVVGLTRGIGKSKLLIDGDQQQSCSVIGPYLTSGTNVIVSAHKTPINERTQMYLGNMAKDGGNLIFERAEKSIMLEKHQVPSTYVKDFWGAYELMRGVPRCCLWLLNANLKEASENEFIDSQIKKVRNFRLSSKASSTRDKARISHRFVQLSSEGGDEAIIIPAITSENRDFLPVTIAKDGAIIGHKCYALYDAPLWNMALIASRLHWVWIGTVCVRMRTDFSYSNTLGWNTFPVPTLTAKNKEDLTRCAEDILLARERHFPATIADLYKPDQMPEDLRRAHERNDEVLERIYIGRRFKNDTERLEKLFALYTEMTTTEATT